MPKFAFACGLAILMTLGGTALADHDQPGPDWISKADVIKQMQGQGYSGIILEADDGHWEGEAIKDGRIVEFDADPHTGKITRVEPKHED